MTAPALTKAQEAALDWLPGDGSREQGAGRLAPALNALRRRGWVEGRKGGDSNYFWRLTPAGLALKAQREGV